MNLHAGPQPLSEMFEPTISIQLSQCPVCAGALRIFTGDHVSWEECVICHEPRLIGWSSCQVAVLDLTRQTDIG